MSKEHKEESKTPATDSDELQYLHGLGNHFETESIEGALPEHRNSPQQCKFGLYAEQLSGTPFTYPRAKFERSWLYRIMPTVAHPPYTALKDFNNLWMSEFCVEDNEEIFTTPMQMRWDPPKVPTEKVTFVQGIQTISGAGSTMMKVSIIIGSLKYRLESTWESMFVMLQWKMKHFSLVMEIL